MGIYRRYKIAVWALSLVVILQWALFFIITRPKRIPKPEEKAPLAAKGKIAIVIDDWGYNLNNLYILEQIKHPLTCAILPNLAYSKEIAQAAHGNGHEIILHLPMEPHEKYRLEQNTIMVSMSEPTIIDIIDKDLAGIPYVAGVSNHMGSKAVEDLGTMTTLFKEIKKRNIYFLDSLVSPRSVCSKLSGQMHIRFAKRDVFLDNEEDRGYIKGQMDKLKNKARIYGQAIGIGHDRKLTLEALKEAMPQLEKEGYKFVFVSELVK